MPITIGGGNYNVGLRHLDEQNRQQELAARLRQQAIAASSDQQRIALAQREQRFNESRSQEQSGIEMAKISAQIRNQALQQAEDKRRFDVSRGDTLENREYGRGRDADETGYRRSMDAENRNLALENRDYSRGRDGVMDTRWQEQQDAVNRDREERRRLTEDENKRRDARESKERELLNEKQDAWKQDRAQQSKDRQMSARVSAIDTKIRAKERDYQTAIQLGEEDIVARLNQELGMLDEEKARAIDADTRDAAISDDGEMVIGPRNSGASAPRSIREDLAASVGAKAKEKKAEKDMLAEEKRRDTFAKDMMQKAGSASASTYADYVKSEAKKRGITEDDPAVQRAIEANPTAREIQTAEKELSTLAPADQMGEIAKTLESLQDPKQRLAVQRGGVNVRELSLHLQRKLAVAQRLVETGRAKAEKRVAAVKGPSEWTSDEAIEGAILPGLQDAAWNYRDQALQMANPANIMNPIGTGYNAYRMGRRMLGYDR